MRRWFGNIGSTGQQAGSQLGEPFVRVDPSMPTPDYGIDGALQVSTVWAAVELLADNIASLPIFVYKRARTAQGYKELARDVPFYRLLHDDPNRRHTPYEFWQYMTMNFILRGNAYARLIRNDAGEVIEMWPLASDQVEVKVLKDRSIIYEYSYEGQIAVYAEDSIFHWRDKGNGVIGMSRLDFMRSSVGVAINVQNHTSRTFQRSGKRPGVFMLDKVLTKVQRETIRANHAALVEGNENDLMVLEAGAKFEPLSMSPVDLQMDEARKFSVQDIARWFGVPGALINDASATSAWGQGIGKLVEGFHKFRLRPILIGLGQALEKRVANGAQRARYEVEISADAILSASLTDRVDIYAKQVQNGLKTRAEVRQLENDPFVPGSDKLTAQTNLTPLDKLGTMPASGASNANQEKPVSQ